MYLYAFTLPCSVFNFGLGDLFHAHPFLPSFCTLLRVIDPGANGSRKETVRWHGMTGWFLFDLIPHRFYPFHFVAVVILLACAPSNEEGVVRSFLWCFGCSHLLVLFFRYAWKELPNRKFVLVHFVVVLLFFCYVWYARLCSALLFVQLWFSTYTSRHLHLWTILRPRDQNQRHFQTLLAFLLENSSNIVSA